VAENRHAFRILRSERDRDREHCESGSFRAEPKVGGIAGRIAEQGWMSMDDKEFCIIHQSSFVIIIIGDARTMAEASSANQW
jgi:hypothetical protein